jgi:transcriptional regulator with XRE-family HTH domain
MTAMELKDIRAKLELTQKQLAELVGIAANNLARQERGELGISEPVARLIRLLAAGIDVEAIINAGASGRAPSPKSQKGSKSRHSQGKGRGRAR